jgi:hypothetical protein
MGRFSLLFLLLPRSLGLYGRVLIAGEGAILRFRDYPKVRLAVRSTLTQGFGMIYIFAIPLMHKTRVCGNTPSMVPLGTVGLLFFGSVILLVFPLVITLSVLHVRHS